MKNNSGKVLFVSSLICFGYVHPNQVTTQQPTIGQPVVQLTVNTTATSASATNNNADPSLIPCTQYFGKERKDCLRCLILQDLYRALCAMNSRARSYYYGLLNNAELVLLRREFLKAEPAQIWWQQLYDLKDEFGHPDDFAQKIDKVYQDYQKSLS